MEATYNIRNNHTPVMFLDDVAPWQENYVPLPYRHDDKIKGVYLYIKRNFLLEGENWENTIRTFCKEEVKITLSGRGSVKVACDLIQSNWQRFCRWMVSKGYKRRDE